MHLPNLSGRISAHDYATPALQAADTRRIFLRVARASTAHRTSGHAAEMAFFAVLTLVPSTVAVGSAFALLRGIVGPAPVADAEDAAVHVVRTIMGPDLSEKVIAPFIHAQLEQPHGGVALGGLLAAWWLSSHLFMATSHALDYAYGVRDRRPTVVQRFIALGFGLVSVAVVALTVELMVTGPLGNPDGTLARHLGIGHVYSVAWSVLRWPVLLVTVVAFLACLYRFSPNVRQAGATACPAPWPGRPSGCSRPRPSASPRRWGCTARPASPRRPDGRDHRPGRQCGRGDGPLGVPGERRHSGRRRAQRPAARRPNTGDGTGQRELRRDPAARLKREIPALCGNRPDTGGRAWRSALLSSTRMAPRGSGDVSEVLPPQAEATLDRERAEDLVLRLVAAHADSLLRVARRYSLCADDAYDAYQRGLEILMRHAARLDPEGAPGWLHTTVKHEAMAINRSRRRMLGAEDFEPDALEARATETPEERALAADRVARSAEALHGLKPHEVRALWLKALGHSYEQICALTGWSYTKVNRCLAEGRKSFLERYAGIESGAECARLAPVLSAFVDGEADAARTMELRAHLRRCLACKASVRGLHEAAHPLAVVLPATGMATAGAGADHAGSFFFRVYEAVSLHLHERTASSVMRAQAIVDTVTAYKMAAVAASAAALAGGGVAVEGAFNTRDDRPGIAVRDLAGVAASAPAVHSAPDPATHHAKRRTKAKAKAARPRHSTHRSAPAAHRTPSTTTPAPTYASAPAARAPAPAPQAPASQPVATTASASASAPSGGSSAAAEFGIEGP